MEKCRRMKRPQCASKTWIYSSFFYNDTAESTVKSNKLPGPSCTDGVGPSTPGEQFSESGKAKIRKTRVQATVVSVCLYSDETQGNHEKIAHVSVRLVDLRDHFNGRTRSRLRPTLAKPTLAILIFRLWPNPTLAKPTLAKKFDRLWPTLIDRLWPNRLWPTLIGRLWPILVF